MGHKIIEGVEIRDVSMRLVFSWRGKQHREILRMSEVDKTAMRPTAANIKFAQRMVREINKAIREGTFVFEEYFPHSKNAAKTVPESFGEYMDKWYAQLNLKKSTLASYRRYKDAFWKPQLGDRPVKSIKHSDITLALKKGEWRSGKTRNNVLSIARSVFELAISDKLIDENPCAEIKQAKWQRKMPDPFEIEEAELIIAHLRKHYPAQAANFFEFQFFAGLRTSEAIGLQWENVDLRKGTVHVCQGFVINELEDATKTDTSRTVILNSRALAVIKAQKEWTYLEGERVFHDPGTNRPWAYEQNARKRYWIPTLKALGIRYRRPYNTRQTYATVGLMSGVNPTFMAKQLGHDVKTFFWFYADWIDGDASDAEMQKIEQKIGLK
jgi:integrase